MEMISPVCSQETELGIFTFASAELLAKFACVSSLRHTCPWRSNPHCCSLFARNVEYWKYLFFNIHVTEFLLCVKVD